MTDFNNLDPGAMVQTAQTMLPQVLDMAGKIIILIIILLVGRKVINVFTKMIEKSLQKVDIDLGIKKFLVSLVRIACYAVLVFILADRLGISSASIVAVLGSAGIAIGLALQGSLANFAGGMLILFMKPFRVGDFITCAAGDGTVQNIGLIYTSIVTIDNKVITVPNGSLSNGVMVNLTALDYRRVDVVVGISYSSDIATAKKVFKHVYESCDAILADKGITIYVDSLADSAVMIGGRGWCKTEDYWTARWYVNENVKLEFDKAGIEIPFNQMDVHIINK